MCLKLTVRSSISCMVVKGSVSAYAWACMDSADDAMLGDGELGADEKRCCKEKHKIRECVVVVVG